MKAAHSILLALPLAGAALLAAAQPAAPPPDFAVAYRAWELVTSIARERRDAALAGECGSNFQPFVVPALRRQTKEEQGAAAVACHRQARALCAASAPARTPEFVKRCEEFR